MKKRKKVVKKRSMKKTFFFLVLLVAIIGLLIIGLVYSAQGTVWISKDCMNGAYYNTNYKPGEMLYINIDRFNPGTYHWEIKGQPGGASCDPGVVVARGEYGWDNKEHDVCFKTYIIKNDDCGEYKVTFGSKTDNYQVIKNSCALEVYGTAYLDEIGGATQSGASLDITCRHNGLGTTKAGIKSNANGQYSVNFLEGECALGDSLEIAGYIFPYYGENTGTLSECNTQLDVAMVDFTALGINEESYSSFTKGAYKSTDKIK